MTAQLVDDTATRTAPSRRRDREVSEYAELSRRVKDAGLLNRRRGWYVGHIAACVAAFAGVWVAVVLLGDSWWQLAVAALLARRCSPSSASSATTARTARSSARARAQRVDRPGAVAAASSG